ncbi:carboxymuconolactone decarboxylase family protein [Akkermansia sp.]|uniref:carboxymuconolactone decarboxylase family protein n=1 Tax=Akkermansia sp. TaxID=1872421 RepID=UPI0025BFD9BF|nr:carboxymuconolactone decarboxylase family protein [Akkermansia sp.]MCD8272962.1 carboxymuconolactone decarboxylase family protein [Akkermansia sp.]
MKLFSLILCCLMSSVSSLMADSTTSSQELTSRQKHIITIAAYTGKGNLHQLRPALNAALDSGLTINEIREVLVHSYAYCGFPRSLRGLQTFISVLDKRKSQGIADVPGRDASPSKDKRSRYDRGCAILAEISGAPVNGPKADYAEFAPVMERFLKEHLFADIFERDILTYDERELATVSLLAAIGGVEPMARSHMGICLNLGITPEQLHQLLDIVSRRISPAEADAAREELNTLLQEKGLPVVSGTGQDAGKTEKSLFPTGTPLSDNPNFTGEAWLQMLVSKADSLDCTVGHVTFAPGARNSWHAHPGGQILLCTSGKGYYQEKGKHPQILRSGDVVKILPNVVHWHGAAPDSEFTHIAIGPRQNKGGVVWLNAVTEEEYNKLPQ